MVVAQNLYCETYFGDDTVCRSINFKENIFSALEKEKEKKRPLGPVVGVKCSYSTVLYGLKDKHFYFLLKVTCRLYSLSIITLQVYSSRCF